METFSILFLNNFLKSQAKNPKSFLLSFHILFLSHSILISYEKGAKEKKSSSSELCKLEKKKTCHDMKGFKEIQDIACRSKKQNEFLFLIMDYTNIRCVTKILFLKDFFLIKKIFLNILHNIGKFASAALSFFYYWLCQ